MKKPRKLLTPVLILLVLTAAGQVTLAQDTVPSPSGADIIKSVAVIKLPASRFVADSAEASRSGEARQPEPAVTSLLNRVGVQTQDSLALSLDDAIRMALENNNNIELTRDDVRFQETQIRAISGAYDPVLTVSPTYTRNSTTGVTSTNDFNVNSSLSQLLRSGGNYTGFFNNSRTENVFAQAQVSSGALGSGGTSAIYSSSYGVRFVQPLMRNFGIDNTRRNLKIARRRLEQTDADFRRQTIDTIAPV
jgi:outer membrane protein TolC